MEEKKRSLQLTKEEKRLLAERSKAVAFAEEERIRQETAAKTARLRALKAAQPSAPAQDT